MSALAMTETLAGPPRSTPDQSEGKVIDKVTEATEFQKGTKQHKKKNIGSGNPHSDTEQPLTSPKHVLNDTIPCISGMAECTRDILSDEIVGHEDKCKPGKIPYNPSSHLKTYDHTYGSNHIVDRQEITSTECYFRIVHDQKAKGKQPCDNTKAVKYRRTRPVSFFVFPRWIQQERQYQKEHDVP